MQKGLFSYNKVRFHSTNPNNLKSKAQQEQSIFSGI